jgi:sugar/nucleoside kinase (ribokinase family)
MSFDRPLRPASSTEFDVVGYGENSIDFLAVLGAFPAPDTKTDLQALEIQPGGQTATAVLAAARLGCRARYVGAFGDDRWAAEIRAALTAGGVDVVAIERASVSTRAAVILVDDAGRRTVLERRDPRLALNEGEVDPRVFQSARILMLDATDVTGSIRAATAARAVGTRVMVDVEKRVDGLEQLLGLADVVIASAGFDQVAAAKPAAAYMLAAAGKPAWITTLGAGGSVARYGDREIRTPAKVVSVRDTTGAGDVFRGAFAARWALEGDVDLEGLLDYANAAAALACRSLGAQGSLPTPGEVERLLDATAGRGKSL